MATNEIVFEGNWHSAGANQFIGVAKPRSTDFEQHLVRLEPCWDWDVLYDVRLIETFLFAIVLLAPNVHDRANSCLEYAQRGPRAWSLVEYRLPSYARDFCILNPAQLNLLRR